MFWCDSYYLGAFGTVWLPYKSGAKRAELVQKFENEVASEFFAPNAPDPPHRTINLCFGAFQTIWAHLGSFGCLTKLGAKRTELVQKFMPRSRVRIFRNERTQSTPLDPKLIFCVIHTIWVLLGLFVCHTNLGAKRAELVQKFENEVASEFFAPNAPIHPIGPQTDLLVHFVLFGCIWDRLVALRSSVQNGPN